MTPHWKEVSDPAVIAAKPLISVAMLAYNHSAFIAEAIEGVAMQKADFPIELVIGVDQSPDNTLDIVLQYQKIYPKLIRVLVPGQRLGMHTNSFLTLGACRAKYIAICEGDDYWTDPTKLEKQVALLESDPTVAGVFHDCYILNQSNGHKRRRIGDRQINRRVDIASLIRTKDIATCSMVFRNVISWQQPDASVTQVLQGDYMLALLVAKHGVWSYLNEPMSVYRVHDGGVWSGIREVERCNHNIQFWRMLESSSDYADLTDVIKARRRNEIRGLSIALAREGKLLQSATAYLRSLGPTRPLHGHYFCSSKYFKEFAGCMTARLGMQTLASGIWRKMTGQKKRST